MAGFHKLLLAIDLSPASTSLIQRVVEMYPEDLGKIHVVHVIKTLLPMDGTQGSEDFQDPDFQRERNNTTSKVLELLRNTGLGCAADKIHLAHGEPSYHIKRLAREINADLVIVGSHIKEDDWMHLPGATTNCVIQGISSDVMAVKV